MSKSKRRRSRKLVKFLLFCAFCAAFFWWSNCSLQIERFTFSSPRLPTGFDGCVIVQLSDLHGAEFGENRDPGRRLVPAFLRRRRQRRKLRRALEFRSYERGRKQHYAESRA